MRYLIQHLLEQTAERIPAREAVRCHGESLTYSELVQGANRLAHVLNRTGIEHNGRVGIYTGKGLDAVTAMYGILKSGAAYVPLDTAAPPERLAKIVQDCSIRHVVSNERQRAGIEKVMASGGRFEYVVGLDDDLPGTVNIPWSEVADQSDSASSGGNPTEMDLAYIIYTSGTTGDPKGIMHTHRSSLSFVDWAVAEYGLRLDDRISNHAPLHFDLSTFDFFAGASAGATTVVIPEAYTKLPASLSTLMQDERISVWYSVPAALIQLLLRGVLADRNLERLRWVIFGGEAFPTKHLRALMKLLPDTRFSQLYGVTETNVCTCYHVPGIPSDPDTPIPIGRVLPNMDGLVVDEQDQPVAAGIAGELLIRGPATMVGYWGRPDLSERVFFRRDRFAAFEEAYYRTGDLVQMLPDGNYRFLGRKDRQVKSRGFRIELGEIEMALLSHADVQEAAAFIVPDGEGSHRVEAAVVVEQPIEEAELLRHVRGKLPVYAVPTRCAVVDRLPRTSTGKLDLRTLQSMAEA